MSAVAVGSQPSWGAVVASASRRLAAVTAAGGLLGLIVGGVGGRLVMRLISSLNPDATGLKTDDEFVIGKVTTDTFDLLFLATGVGVIGGGVYFVLRGLMIGPRWFQVLSISLGPAVVIGSEIVHTDGVDFTLDPTRWSSFSSCSSPGSTRRSSPWWRSAGSTLGPFR